MKIEEMSSVDLNLRLLAGESFYVDDMEIKPLTLREIVRFGYTEYMKCLNTLCINVEDIVENNDEKINLFDVVILTKNQELIIMFAEALKLFLHEKTIDFDHNNGCFILDKKIVTRNNIDEIIEVIKYQNCLKTKEEFNPANEHAIRIKKRLEETKKMVEKAKGKTDEEIDIVSIVSAVSTKSTGYNKQSVFDMTIYQLYDEFKRLDLIENYNVSIIAISNGAKDVKLNHWASKFD